MIILPAIDIKDGNCVRLQKGDFATVHKVAEDPFETASGFAAAGAKWIHMVDLDGAKSGSVKNAPIFLRAAKESGLRVELGGGIRDMETVAYYLDNGISRVILGSAAVKNPRLVKEAVNRYGEHVAVGIDAREGIVATEGWLESGTVSYLDLAKEMVSIGVKYIIFTDISRDGMLSGANFEQLAALNNAVDCNIIASGGIRDISDIRECKELNLYGAICGKSIYSGTLSLKEAVETAGEQVC